MTRTLAYPLLAALALTPVALARAGDASTPGETVARPELSGSWRLDPAKSDDPRAALGERGEGRGERGGWEDRGPGPGGRPGDGGDHGSIGGDGGWGAGGGWGRSGRGGGMGGPGGRGGRGGRGRPGGGATEEDAAWRAHAHGLMRDAETVKIACASSPGERVEVVYGSGAARSLPIDGKWHRPDSDPKHGLESRAAWEGSALVLESKSSHGARSREALERAPDGRLSVRVKLEGGRLRKPVELLRTYDAVTAPAAGAAAPPASAS